MTNARELSSRLLGLLRREQASLADFVVALADFDRQRHWVELGYSSLFYYLHRELKLSAGAAYLRKSAAELIQRFPEAVEPLRDGRLCLSSVGELARVITADNRSEVLPRFFHTSKREAQAVAAEIAPRAAPPTRAIVTPLPPAGPPTAIALPPPESERFNGHPVPPALALGQVPLHPGEMVEPPGAVAPVQMPPPQGPRSTAEPLTSDLRRLHVTVSKRFLEKLEAAKGALSHSHPGVDLEAVLEAGLDLLLQRAATRKGLVKRPRVLAPAHEIGSADPRYVPAAVRRDVWLRDEGRCQWPTADGGICRSIHRLQLDHILPVARGGKATVANLRVTCDFHNDLAARGVFGDSWMDRFTRRGTRAKGGGGQLRSDDSPAARGGG